VTLVVAKRKGDVLALVSDTGVSLSGTQLGPEHHLPKICILNGKLAVGFAGSPELGVTAIASAPKDDGVTFGAVTKHFLDAHLKHDQGIEFILAFGPPLSKLALVSGGKVTQNRTTEWIGDQAAFEAFQEFRQNRTPALSFVSTMLGTSREGEAKLPTFDLIGTMGRVIERRDVSSVFGHAVGINNDGGQFDFRNYTVTLEEKPSFTMPATANPIEVLGQIAEARQFAFSCFVSSPEDALQAVAFHYMRGRLTYVYYGAPCEVLNRFVLYKDMNVIEIGERAAAELGVNWIGGISSREGVPQGYGVPTDQWRILNPRPRPIPK
jgi:hypothetical protein